MTDPRTTIDQRRAELEAVRAAERLARLLIEGTTAGLFIVQHGRLRYVNPALEALTGYTAAELLTGDALRFIHPDQLAAMQQLQVARQHGETAPLRYETRFITRHGDERWAEVTVTPTQFEDQPAYLGTVTDITEHKQAEQALRASEQQLARSQQVAHVGHWTWDVRRNGVTWSAEMHRIFGLDPAHFSGDLDEVIASAIHPADRAKVLQANAAVEQAAQPGSLEYRVVWPDGTVRTVWAQPGDRVTDAQGHILTLSGVVQDITDRKQTEAALRESEERYRLLYDSSLDAILLTSPTGEILAANRAACHMFGQTEDEIKQLGRAGLVDVTDPRLPAALAERARTGRFSGELTFIRRDGRRFPGDLTSALFTDHQGLVRTGMIIRDMSDYRAAAAALLASEKRFRAIFDQAAVGMALVALDGRFQLVNQRLCAICGYPQDRLQTLTFQAITHPDDLSADLAYVDQLLRGELTTYSMEKRYLRADHSIIWINLTVALVRDEAQQPAYFISVIEDISARKQAEDQLRHSREQLRALAAHLESVREEERRWIAREIHDELGQALTGLKMDVTWLARDLRPDQTAPRAKAQGILNLIDTTIGAMRGLIAQMRPGILDDLGLVAALDWQAQEFQQRTGIQCRVDLPADDVALEPERAVVIFRICQEALTNVTRHAQATQVTIRLTVAEHALTLRVADNGRGIRLNEVDSPQAFGLIGMRERTLLLGGTVSIAPQVQGGTCVTVSIPIHAN